MTPAEELRAARELIADPEHWTTQAAARGKSGRGVNPDGRAACQWCALGALARVGGNIFTPSRVYLGRAARSLYKSRPAIVNDELGHEAALAMFDLAIEYAQADQ